jgi:hypothetical protein
MPLMVGDGGGGTAEGSVPWPQIDMASLCEAASCLGGQSKVVTQAASTLSSARNGVSSWSGPAAAAWQETTKTGLSGLDDVSERLGSASRILNRLFDRITDLQTQYQKAVEAELAARQKLKPAAHGVQPTPAQTVGSLAWLLIDGDRLDAIRAEQSAVDNVHDAAHAASTQLSRLCEGLPAPMRLGHVGAPPGPSGPFITMLFGSIVGANRISGLQFQDEVLRLLGLRENMANFQGLVGSKGFRPDSLGGDDDDLPVVVIEVKNALSVSRIAQILNEIALAESKGVPFTLVVNGVTKLSGPLVRALEAAAANQGSPSWYRYWGGGRVTDGASGDPVRPDPTTHGFTPSRPQPGDPPPAPPAPPADADPTPPGDPVDPGGDGGGDPDLFDPFF